MSQKKKRIVQPPAATILPMESFQPAFNRSAIMGAMLCSAVAISPAVSAQDQQTRELDTVIVTGSEVPEVSNSRFTAPLLDTPRTVNIISEETIRERGATSLQDVLRTTPGITLGSGEGGTPQGDRPMIRGYEASTDIFIDGVRDYGRGSHETFNLEAVEVVKGPSSAYTGRGGTGGSVNMSTKQPRLENFADLSVGIGSEGQWRAAADGNYAFTDNAAFRLNVMKMGGDVPGRDVLEYDRFGIAPSLAVGLDTQTRAIISYSLSVNKDTPDWGMAFRNDANPDRSKPLEPSQDNYYGRAGIDYRENELQTATLRLEHDFTPNLTLTNVTRWSNNVQEYLYTRPTFENCTAAMAGTAVSCATEDQGLQFRRDNRARWRETESVINQTELSGNFNTGTINHNFVAGFEFTNEGIYSRSATVNNPVRSHDSFWNPNPNQNWGPLDIDFGNKTQNGEFNTKSIYAFNTLEFNPQWLVNLGLRVEDYRVTNMTDTRNDTLVNYQAGVVYKPVPQGSIYLSYGTSSNPAGDNLGQGGGADGVAGAGSLNKDLEPEESHTWELGTKWEVLDQLTLNAAIFQTDKTNARSQDPVTGDTSVSGNNQVQGIEVSATGNITPEWSVWAGYTYLDPEIKRYRSGGVDYDGNQIKFIAEHSATLWTSYQLLPQWTVGGGLNYVGERFANDANTLTLPSHTTLDAMVSYAATDNLSIQLNANNLTDERVWDASHVGIFANIGPRRSFMLNAHYRF